VLFRSHSERYTQKGTDDSIPPFYVDTTNDRYGVLSTDDGEIAPHPYNALVALATTMDEAISIREETETKSVVFKELNSYITKFALSVTGETDEDFFHSTDKWGELGKALADFAVSYYWKGVLGVDPFRRANPDLANQRKRKTGGDKMVSSEYVLRRYLWSLCDDPNAGRFTSASVSLLKKIFEKNIIGLERFCKSDKKGWPRFEALLMVSGAPVLSIQKYETLFHSEEWSIVTGSSMQELSVEFAERRSKAVGWDDVKPTFLWLKSLRGRVSKDPVSTAILRVKQKRIQRAAELKRYSKRAIKLSEIGHLIRSENDVAVFSPFEILGAVNAPGSELGVGSLTRDENGRYSLIESTIQRASPAVQAAARSYVMCLNGH